MLMYTQKHLLYTGGVIGGGALGARAPSCIPHLIKAQYILQLG